MEKKLILNLLNELKASNKYLQSSYNNKFVPGESTIYYSGPYWSDDELVEAIHSMIFGKWLSSGENVRKFEVQYSKAINQSYGVMVNSGSSANLVMMAALKKYFGWEDGDEIIVSVVGFPTTISVISQNNLTPVFVDIEMDSLNFDINLIDSKITNKTKAIFVSPVLGNPPNMDKLLKYKDMGIELILDGCDSLGTLWKGEHLSSYFVATSHSFYPAHHITTGEGGMVTSNNAEIIKIARSLAWWGRDCYCVGSANLLSNGTCCNRFDKWLKNYDGIVDHKYIFTNMGYNLKPMDFQGAIGIQQLKKMPEIISKRISNKAKMESLLNKYIPSITVVKDEVGAITSWFGVPCICQSREDKHTLVSLLEDNKIQTRNYFAGNILLHPGYSHLGNYLNYPNANKVLDQVFFLGVSPHYTDDVFAYIESVLQKWKN